MRLRVERLSKIVFNSENKKTCPWSICYHIFTLEKPSLYKTLHISSKSLPASKGKTWDFSAYSVHAALCVCRNRNKQRQIQFLSHYIVPPCFGESFLLTLLWTQGKKPKLFFRIKKIYLRFKKISNCNIKMKGLGQVCPGNARPHQREQPELWLLFVHPAGKAE